MIALTEKRKMYEKVLNELVIKRQTEIDEKVKAYKETLEAETNEEITNLQNVIGALDTIINYESSTEVKVETALDRPGMQVFGMK